MQDIFNQTKLRLTALLASSGVEKATKPDPLLCPFESTVT